MIRAADLTPFPRPPIPAAHHSTAEVAVCRLDAEPAHCFHLRCHVTACPAGARRGQSRFPISMPRSSRVMCYKKGSDLYSIPFDIPFTYTPLQIDNVSQSERVQPTGTTRQTNVETIGKAVQLYLHQLSAPPGAIAWLQPRFQPRRSHLGLDS